MSATDAPLIPRQYQHEIFLRACKGNVIAALDTGSGKTFIAALLIRWVASQPSLGTGKKIFFLVPKVALVEQQRAFVASQTQLRVGGFSGAMNVDMWDRQKWTAEIAKSDVLVMTHQIMLDLLRHAFFPITSVSLLVIDEAHHTRGNHPYARIMTEHYEHIPPGEHRPKIFGLTASPIWNPKNPQQSLRVLEQTMDAKVISVLENVAELKTHSPRAQEMIIRYPGMPRTHGYGFPSLWNDLIALDDFRSYLGEDNSYDVQRRYLHARESLGFHAADYYLSDMLTSRIDAQIQAHVPEAFATPGSPSKRLHRGVRGIQAVLARHAPRFEPSAIFAPEFITPKMEVLIKTLNAHRTEHLQAVVFVEQRHVASAMSWLLSIIPELNWVKSRFLIGHTSTEVEARAMAVTAQRKLVEAFRKQEFNILVASSVAEEGLDFQSLSLVVRFDAVLHMVSFAQSRGRARHEKSSFAVMIQDDDKEQLMRYQIIATSEAAMREEYARDRDQQVRQDDDDDDEDYTDGPRYVTPKNALLTYASAVSLLNDFCALFRADKFTPSLAPKYTITTKTGSYQSTVTLPSALPIPRNELFYEGPICISKRTAKGGAAFNAVKALHSRSVFDDYLLPVQKSDANAGEGQDADGKMSKDISKVKKMMAVNVRDPWGDPWTGDVWLHPIVVSDRPVAGLVTGAQVASDFPHCFNEHGEHVRLGEGVRLSFAGDEERLARLKVMQDYSREGIIWGISASRRDRGVASVMIVLLQEDLTSPDYEAMEAFIRVQQVPWTRETHLSRSTSILARHRRKHRALLFMRVRDDLTPLSEPVLFPDQRNDEKGYSSYLDFYQRFWSRPGRSSNPIPIDVREDDLMLEFKELKRARTKVKVLRSFDRRHTPQPQAEDESAQKDFMTIVPHSALLQMKLPLEILGIFHLLPHLIRHITSYYRARVAQQRLGFPPLDLARHVEGLTLPSSGAGFDYQRLETLGDSCLKMATSVHIFTKFPHHHEGQLTRLRMASVSNVYLLGRALESHLYEFINGETSSVGRSWSIPLVKDITHDEDGNTMVKRQVPSKAMQDCLEASLGVAWLSGGMDTVLKVGTALKVCFGGDVPWTERNYGRVAIPSESPPAFKPIEEALGYQFRDPLLLSEALTHPSMPTSDTGSYDRLEFLGDALVELFIIQNIFHRWPNAQPGRLSWNRASAVCNATLSAVAIKVLSLDKSVLHASPLLPDAMKAARKDFEDLSFTDVINNTWRYGPPKVLGDLTESVLGAVLVDSNFDLKRSFEVVAHVMSGVVDALHFNVPKDPITEMLKYMAQHGCVKGSFRKQKSTPEALKVDCTAVLIHGKEVVPPVPAVTVHVSKSYTCARVWEALRTGEIDLNAICSCAAEREAEAAKRLLSPTPEREAVEDDKLILPELLQESEPEPERGELSLVERTEEEFVEDQRKALEDEDVDVQVVESDEEDSDDKSADPIQLRDDEMVVG